MNLVDCISVGHREASCAPAHGAASGQLRRARISRGNFEDALYAWRSQAAAWVRPEEGVVLASGAGALGVRLGEPIPVGASFAERPALGTGEPAREDALASLEGLLWRALVLWMIVYLLAAALRIA